MQMPEYLRFTQGVCVRLIKRFIVCPTEKCLVLFRWDNDLEMNR
jgi:hypothetical protein